MLDVSPIQKPTIKVYGMAGMFHVGADSAMAGVRVRYFNTVASGKDSDTAGNSRSLLQELKPMRERVQVSALRNLSTLLQRELDDGRVAKSLVPYLQGKTSNVGFFPGILVALVPKGFLESSNVAVYPQPTISAGNETESYDKLWKLTRFKSGDVLTALGQLEIDPKDADLIVLDGQHRANAFRYITGTFDAAEGDTIYSAFYQDAGEQIEFDSELPVTILWFEATGQLDPTLISRQLFVDVNTNAVAVSESRNILLDDRNPPSIIVGAIYRLLASRGFDTNHFSLLHGGFDCEEDEQHPLALFLPAQFRFAISYFAFAPDKYDALSSAVKGDFSRTIRNFNRAQALIKGGNETDFRAAEKGDKDAVKKLGEALDKNFGPEIVSLIETFCLVREHMQATQDLETAVADGSSKQRETWEKVFCGGEGLYGAFKRNSPGARAEGYKKVIKEIEDQFRQLRAQRFSGVTPQVVFKAYEAFSSKAGLTGLLMAAQSYCKATKGWSSRTDFINTLNKLTPVQWINVLAVYKPLVVKNLDPKLWPSMRAIFLRVAQGVDPSLEFFPTTLEDDNPDAQVLKELLRDKWLAYKTNLPADVRETQRPDQPTIDAWCSESITTLTNALAQCGLTPVSSEDSARQFCTSFVKHQLLKGVPQESAHDDDDEDDGEGEEGFVES